MKLSGDVRISVEQRLDECVLHGDTRQTFDRMEQKTPSELALRGRFFVHLDIIAFLYLIVMLGR